MRVGDVVKVVLLVVGPCSLLLNFSRQSRDCVVGRDELFLVLWRGNGSSLRAEMGRATTETASDGSQRGDEQVDSSFDCVLDSGGQATKERGQELVKRRRERIQRRDNLFQQRVLGIGRVVLIVGDGSGNGSPDYIQGFHRDFERRARNGVDERNDAIESGERNRDVSLQVVQRGTSGERNRTCHCCACGRCGEASYELTSIHLSLLEVRVYCVA